MYKCLVCSQDTIRLRRECKGTSDVRTEFDRNSDRHDEIDERQCVERYRPEVHETEHAGQDHSDRDHDHDRGPEIETEENERHQEDGGSAHRQVEESVPFDGQVLLVEYVEDAGKN